MNAWKLKLVGLFLVALVGCDGHLREPEKPNPALDNTAEVSISTNGNEISRTMYANLSSSFFLQCLRDHNGLVYINARTWLKDGAGSLQPQWLTFWFPMPLSSQKQARKEWAASDGIQIYGKLGVSPYYKLGANLKGSCVSSLALAGRLITGAIMCTDFSSTEADRLPSYDLKIENLNCYIED